VWDTLGSHEEFPYAATTYRLTEHFHFWTKHCKLNAIAQPEQFVEIGEVLAKEKGIKAGDRVRCRASAGISRRWRW
jgi:formate dehydrogenase major subunit